MKKTSKPIQTFTTKDIVRVSDLKLVVGGTQINCGAGMAKNIY